MGGTQQPRLWSTYRVLLFAFLSFFLLSDGKTNRHAPSQNSSSAHGSKGKPSLLSSMVGSGSAEGDLLGGISRKSIKDRKNSQQAQVKHEKEQQPHEKDIVEQPIANDVSTNTTNSTDSDHKNEDILSTKTEVMKTNSNKSSNNKKDDLLQQLIRGGSNIDPMSGNSVGGNDDPELLFYMYDLHEKFWWRWPANGTEKECQENGYLSTAHAEYSAIGRPIIPDDGLFLTWHFSMFNSLYNRLKRSHRRTKDPTKASMFVIPYDLGLDGYLNPRNCGNRRSCTEGLIGKLMETLNSMPYFARHQGADHVVLWSLGQYHPWPRAGCDIFMRNTCAMCTLSCYWMDHTKPENRFVSMPFPAAYHYWDGIQRLPWDTQRASERNLTAVYLGSTLTLNPWHTKIRRAMAAQCNATTDCHWLKIAHSSIDNSIGDLLSVYQKAVFCLCPPGDDPARKAVFDAIVSGCIPVIFEVATLYNQYPWHIGEDAALDISVYIPGGAMRSGKLQFMEVLRKIPQDVIRKKQWALAQVAPRIQYSIPPLHLLADKYDETMWRPPFHDAAEIALDGFFQRTQRMLRNVSTHIPHRFMTGREWGADYDSVKVQIPGKTVFFGEEINALPLSERHSYKDKYHRTAAAAATTTATTTSTEEGAKNAETSSSNNSETGSSKEHNNHNSVDMAVPDHVASGVYQPSPHLERRHHNGKRGHHTGNAAGHSKATNNNVEGNHLLGNGNAGVGQGKRRHHHMKGVDVTTNTGSD